MQSDNGHVETNIHVSIALCSCFLSIFGSSLIILTYLAYPEIRKPARKLLLWLSVCDLGTGLIYAINFMVCKSKCECPFKYQQKMFALLGIWFPVASFLWTDCIGLYIYAATYQKTWMAPRERLFTIFHIVCWGLPTVVCVSIGIIQAIDPTLIEISSGITGGWCWITEWQWDLLGGKVIEIFSYIFLVVVYWLTWKELKRITINKKLVHIISPKNKNNDRSTPSTTNNKNDSNLFTHTIESNKQYNTTMGSGSRDLTSSLSYKSRQQTLNSQLRQQNKAEAVNRLLFIPVVFFFLRIWGTAHMIVDQTHYSSHISSEIFANVLMFGQAICDPLQGFCNGILFVVFVSEVRQYLFYSLNKYIKYKYLQLCGIICCCYYCFACCCSSCNECFDCCLDENNMYNNNFIHSTKIKPNMYNTRNHFIGQSKYDYNKMKNTDYFQSKYQFVSPGQKNAINTSPHNNTNNNTNNNDKTVPLLINDSPKTDDKITNDIDC